jgi:hypothetical protein
MFNERARHIQQRIVAGTWRLRSAQTAGFDAIAMTMGARIRFGMAGGAATSIRYRLLTRFPKRRVIEGLPADHFERWR